MIDLHTHSNKSDGTCSPSEVVALAAKAGLSAVALCDHDTVDGTAEAVAAGEKMGLYVLPAGELSIDGPITIHFSGLFVDSESEALKSKLCELKNLRSARNFEIIRKLRSAGIVLDDSELRSDPSRSATRANIGRMLVSAGYADDVGTAIEQYLKPGGKGYVPSHRFKDYLCIETILAAGGLPVICHINQINLDLDELAKTVSRYKKLGLVGIEAEYTEYDDFWRAKARELAQQNGLLLSGGSDFHGSIKRNKVGIGFGNLSVPDEFLEALKKRAAITKK